MNTPIKFAFLSSLKDASLPGLDSHEKVMSYPRDTVERALKKEPKPRQSAVLILLYQKDNLWKLALIKRNVYHGTHSGQISLPGGKKEPFDKDLIDTALRETEEEIGVKKDQVEILKELSPLYIPPSNFIVQPVLSIMKETPTFIPEPREVDRILEMPLHFLLDDSNLKETTVILSGTNQKIKVKAYLFEGEIIWGATAMILAELSEMLKN